MLSDGQCIHAVYVVDFAFSSIQIELDLFHLSLSALFSFPSAHSIENVHWRSKKWNWNERWTEHQQKNLSKRKHKNSLVIASIRCIGIHLNWSWFKWSWRKRIKFLFFLLMLSFFLFHSSSRMFSQILYLPFIHAV